MADTLAKHDNFKKNDEAWYGKYFGRGPVETEE